MPDPFASKKDLDAQWMPKVNDHLAKHGLIAQLHAYWNYNGQSSTPMMQMLVSSQSSHPSPIQGPLSSPSLAPAIRSVDRPARRDRPFPDADADARRHSTRCTNSVTRLPRRR